MKTKMVFDLKNDSVIWQHSIFKIHITGKEINQLKKKNISPINMKMLSKKNSAIDELYNLQLHKINEKKKSSYQINENKYLIGLKSRISDKANRHQYKECAKSLMVFKYWCCQTNMIAFCFISSFGYLASLKKAPNYRCHQNIMAPFCFNIYIHIYLAPLAKLVINSRFPPLIVTDATNKRWKVKEL